MFILSKKVTAVQLTKSFRKIQLFILFRIEGQAEWDGTKAWFHEEITFK